MSLFLVLQDAFWALSALLSHKRHSMHGSYQGRSQDKISGGVGGGRVRFRGSIEFGHFFYILGSLTVMYLFFGGLAMDPLQYRALYISPNVRGKTSKLGKLDKGNNWTSKSHCMVGVSCLFCRTIRTPPLHRSMVRQCIFETNAYCFQLGLNL